VQVHRIAESEGPRRRARSSARADRLHFSAGCSAGNAAGGARQEILVEAFVTALTIFVLALFIGWEIISKVPPLLHTPLMSGSNAISGITILGAMLSVASPDPWSTILGFIAIVFATINVVGGFLVTHRMLAMFKKKD
jgi:NAD(P) transhydrogenase subunit alpha